MLDEPSLGLAPIVVEELFRIVGELNREEGLTVLVVEQNANAAFSIADRAYVLEVGRVACRARVPSCARTRTSAGATSVLMQEFLQQLVFGLSIGSVYGSLALALVLIHRATGS